MAVKTMGNKPCDSCDIFQSKIWSANIVIQRYDNLQETCQQQAVDWHWQSSQKNAHTHISNM